MNLSRTLPIFVFGSTILLAGCGGETAIPSQATEKTGPKIVKTEARSPGMVAAANPYAVEAGLEILREGGSAVDAAIAVQAVLGLVEPQSSGLGGGAFMVVYDPKTAKVWTYDGRETAPAGVKPDMFLDEDGQPLRYIPAVAAGQSTGVPGAVVMLHSAHEDYGNLPWARTMDNAVKLAEDGFDVSPRLAGLLARFAKFAMVNDPDSKAYFYDGDATLPIGFKRDNPAYADTLRAIQANPRALLEGPLAEAIIAKTALPPRPGTMTLDDMAAYQPKKREALCSTYRAHAVCGAQPPASGGIAVQAILGILENFDLAAMGPSIEGWHAFTEASFLSYADRDRYVADDSQVEVPVQAMLDKDYLASRAKLIQPDSAITDVKPGNPAGFVRGRDDTPDSPGTSHFSIVDKTGLTVSMTTTVEGPFGSQRMVGGFMLNNQLTDFARRPFDAAGNPVANVVAPGKRPRSSMSPHIVFNPDGEFLFTTGSPGGNSIIAYTAKSIVGVLDWEMSPQEAIELPNVIARNGRIRAEAENLKAEGAEDSVRGRDGAEFGLSDEIIEGLEALGHEIVRSDGETSGLHIIYRQADGTLIGGADPRREGQARLAD